MTITAATSADWVDFWENEMTSSVDMNQEQITAMLTVCLLYTSPSPRDATLSRMPSSA